MKNGATFATFSSFEKVYFHKKIMLLLTSSGFVTAILR